MAEPIKVIIVGMGIRSEIYARESLVHPDLFKIVGVVDINPHRVKVAQETFDIPDERCFTSVKDLVAVPKFADAVINGTMDKQHVVTTVPLLEHGYDVLLEKPFALDERQAKVLLECAKKTGRKVMVCHVLRYSPFYTKIKEVVDSGEIGKIINIRMAEQVNYFHQSVSYVRGKYASEKLGGAGLLLSKCSHDIDIMTWLMGSNLPVSVASVGSVFQFKPEMAPEGAGTHCIKDCKIKDTCPYASKKLYIDHPQRWADNVWHDCGYEEITEEEKMMLLSQDDNPFSRCIYKCDIDIVDHQSVLINFADGANGTFTVNGGAPESARRIHITGTKGEIVGVFEEGCFEVRLIAPEEEDGRRVRKVDVSSQQDGSPHGFGDQLLVRDFITLMHGEKTSPCCTTLEDSAAGHRLVFLAEKSRKSGGRMRRF